jgi:hypothetical protein
LSPLQLTWSELAELVAWWSKAKGAKGKKADLGVFGIVTQGPSLFDWSKPSGDTRSDTAASLMGSGPLDFDACSKQAFEAITIDLTAAQTPAFPPPPGPSPSVLDSWASVFTTMSLTETPSPPLQANTPSVLESLASAFTFSATSAPLSTFRHLVNPAKAMAQLPLPPSVLPVERLVSAGCHFKDLEAMGWWTSLSVKDWVGHIASLPQLTKDEDFVARFLDALHKSSQSMVSSKP